MKKYESMNSYMGELDTEITQLEKQVRKNQIQIKLIKQRKNILKSIQKETSTLEQCLVEYVRNNYSKRNPKYSVVDNNIPNDYFIVLLQGRCRITTL